MKFTKELTNPIKQVETKYLGLYDSSDLKIYQEMRGWKPNAASVVGQRVVCTVCVLIFYLLF